MNREPWNKRRIAELRLLWAEGLSASEIAKRLGDVGKNSIAGKIHRLGLSGRPSGRYRRLPCD